MRKIVLALTLSLAAAPAFAGFGSIDLPRLDWPTDETVTGSTKGCELDPKTAVEAPACQ
ncbi:hypothetical protein ACSBLW_14925 [Thioclava sp. FR2]|uniref:hypothetical protein n=1 Tax=Thioclava sp. FR2 TaxID=3445780 RepID=UPI003EBF9277